MTASVDQSELAKLNGLPLAVVLVEADGRVIWSSDQARHILGRCDNLADALTAYTADTRFDDWPKILAEQAASGRPAQLLHINCHHSNGRSGVMNLFLSSLPGESGQPGQSLAFHSQFDLADLNHKDCRTPERTGATAHATGDGYDTIFHVPVYLCSGG